jgi:hypothetical protein
MSFSREKAKHGTLSSSHYMTALAGDRESLKATKAKRFAQGHMVDEQPIWDSNLVSGLQAQCPFLWTILP